MSQALKEIVRFQTDRELDKKEFNVINENTSIVEELLEAHGFDVEKKDRPRLKENWLGFVNIMEVDGVTTPIKRTISPNDRVDAYCDAIVFAVGALLKLGYEPELALLEAGKEINSREGSMVDGKFEKDLSDEAQAKWYKANYAECKIKES